jgi:uncharacterized protein (DUF983 family)
MVGRLVRGVIAGVLGLALAFFVAVSGFADGPARERALTIGLIVVAYGLVGLALGYRGSAWYGMALALPGMVVLLLYTVSEGNWRFPLYAALIAAVAVAGAYGGSRSGRREGGATLETDLL